MHTYVFLHSEEVDGLLDELKRRGKRLKPKFKKLKYAEIFAEGEGIVAGRYENVAFFLFEDDFDLSVEPLATLSVVYAEADGKFEDFKYGKYLIEGGTVRLDIRAEEGEREELLLDLIPALHVLLTKIEILLNQCSLQSEAMSKEETRIIREVSNLSHLANRSKDVSELEDILSEVSNMHMSFFGKFARFKDVNEEIFSSMVRFEAISRELGWYEDKVREFKALHQSLLYFESKFEQTLNGMRDLFSIISLQLDTMRNRENIDLQRRTSSLQAAAAIIEFVAVFYYTLKIWEYFLPIEELPGALAFLLLTGFTVSVVAYTELLAELVRFRKITKSFVTATLLLMLILFLMFVLPLTFSGALSPSSAR